MKAIEQLMEKGLTENPDVSLVLEIARRARETEERDLAIEIKDYSEVAAIPTEQQYATS